MGTQGSLEEVVVELRRRGLRMTSQRRAVVAEVLATNGHITPAATVRRVQERLPGVNASTIYRTLVLLDEIGVLTHSHLEDGLEYHHASEAGHLHLSCSHCGAEESLSTAEVEPFKAMLEGAHGFSVDLTHFAISGLCRRCRTDQPPRMPGNRSGRSMT